LFLTAGLGKMDFQKFALADLLACTISTVVFFSLYYYFGNSIIEYVKQGNIVLFSLVAIGIGVYFYLKKKKNNNS
jgi:membrane protein DedA with SNARE-associated domain